VPWWRRRRDDEILREAPSGMLEWQSRYQPVPTGAWPEAGVTGLSRHREWDAVVVADAPGIRDDPVVFVALPDGGLLVEVGDEPGDLTPLADAVERDHSRPYRAQAVRKESGRFALGEVVELPETEGDQVTLTMRDGERILELDGRREFGSNRTLERLGAGVGRNYVVRAERLQDDIFEVRVDRL
jgi:hypothetical protein